MVQWNFSLITVSIFLDPPSYIYMYPFVYYVGGNMGV